MPSQLPDISSHGIWSVSSFKQGHGVANLYDHSTTTYWQSDGAQPHWVSIKLDSRMVIHSIRLFLNIGQDENYTPCQINIRAGSSQFDVQQVHLVELEKEPRGWVEVKLSDNGAPLAAQFLLIEFPANYENGLDVHVRQIQIMGPPAAEAKFRAEKILPFTTTEFSMYDSFR
ncbi:Anaphase-promoting complex subunit 10 [Linderina macrospora]|uniref:Anaphase-promoting complex subunit 10 n=1 Tax=Linderina macrospora TaxID=4868 RepID=A0ACC1JFC9_9FUNG|nr:Anaphase-promoting complex subunit 10 [Linderina macrospora]